MSSESTIVEPALPGLALAHAELDEGPPAGASIGRFLVISKLGAGAMGIVVAVYDPELDRKAALKLLSRRGRSESANARLWREAQALAKLNHPNVVTVYDVGIHEGQVWVAMEFVHGVTMRRWLASTRPWPEIVRVFEAAGRGLAAAHAVGLVHRDFKPDNVMIGDDGRVRVMDFGLARGDDEPSESGIRAIEDADARQDSLLSTRLTKTGTLLGTPAYMAPEQWRREAVTARSDQFAFCVALYEALHGKRPFSGGDLKSLARAIARGETEPPSRGVGGPAWLRRVVLRGLAPDPSARHASMDTLLAALLDDPARGRRRSLGGLAVAGVLACSLWVATQPEPTPPSPCAGMDAKLHGIWDADVQRELKAAILATEQTDARGTSERVAASLDAYAESWVAARTDACRSSESDEQSTMLLDLRMECLDERLIHLHATVDELLAVDATALPHAELAVLNLPRLERCSDIAALTARHAPPDDPHAAAKAIELDERLIRASVKLELGRYDEALREVDRVMVEADALAHVPVVVRARLLHGRLLNQLGDYENAIAQLEDVYFLALGENMDDEAAFASAFLLGIYGGNLARRDAAEQWARHAEASARAAPSDEARAVYYEQAGMIAAAASDHARAGMLLEQARQLVIALRGAQHPKLADIEFLVGNVADGSGRLDDARVHFERALAIRTQALGPDSPRLVAILINLGLVHLQQGRLDAAYELLQRGLTIGMASFGPTHLNVAVTLLNLGTIEQRRLHYRAARDFYERAGVAFEAAFGPNNHYLGIVAHNLAEIALARGEVALALELATRALERKQSGVGPEDPLLVSTLDFLANLAIRRGDHVAARGYAERARTIQVEALGAEHPDLAGTLATLAHCAELEGKPDEALALAREGVRLRSSSKGAQVEIAVARRELGERLSHMARHDEAMAELEQAMTIHDEVARDDRLHGRTASTRERVIAQFALAQALWARAGAGDRARALTLAEAAREGIVIAAPSEPLELLSDIEAWLTRATAP